MHIDDFRLDETRWSTLMTILKRRAFKMLTKHTAPLYLKADDMITPSPMTIAAHEKPVTYLLRALSRDGYRDALFDIGANIGLATYFARDAFDRVFGFEPNPEIFHALSANLGRDPLVQLFNFGLGDRNEETSLMAPRGNYGGAFIPDASNAYAPNEIAAVSGFSSFRADDYLSFPIVVKRGRDVLPSLFAELVPNASFTIKIDVEGYEQTILREIAASLPSVARVAILFENWNKAFDAKAFFAEVFGNRGRVLKLVSSLDRHSPLGRNATLLLRGDSHHTSASPTDWVGEVLYLIEPRGSAI
jgi:FkbM family methyltransferase